YMAGPDPFQLVKSNTPNWTNFKGQKIAWNSTFSGLQSALYDMPAEDALSKLKATLVLQRLARLDVPFNANPADPQYNPYVTVDIFPDVPVWNNITKYLDKTLTPNLGSQYSLGRYQPMQRTDMRRQQPK